MAGAEMYDHSDQASQDERDVMNLTTIGAVFQVGDIVMVADDELMFVTGVQGNTVTVHRVADPIPTSHQTAEEFYDDLVGDQQFA